MTKLIDADALLEAVIKMTIGQMRVSANYQDIKTLITNAPTVQREGFDKDTISLEASRKIMCEVNAMTIPIDVRKTSQLQAKIQCVIIDTLSAAQSDY